MEGTLAGLALGAVIGFVQAMTGAGGGILAVPLLVFVEHLPMAQAAPVGLVAVGASASLGALLGLRDGIVRYRAAAMIGFTGMAVAPLGVGLAHVVPNAPLLAAFACVLAYVAWRSFASTRQASAAQPPSTPPCVINPAEGRLTWTLPCARALCGTGLVSGFLSGLLGVGGGFVIVPSLGHYSNLTMRSIVPTSLAVVALVSASAVGSAAWRGAVDWHLAAPFAAGAVAALLVGRRLASRMHQLHLQRAFGAMAALVSVLLLARALGWIAA